MIRLSIRAVRLCPSLVRYRQLMILSHFFCYRCLIRSLDAGCNSIWHWLICVWCHGITHVWTCARATMYFLFFVPCTHCCLNAIVIVCLCQCPFLPHSSSAFGRFFSLSQFFRWIIDVVAFLFFFLFRWYSKKRKIYKKSSEVKTATEKEHKKSDLFRSMRTSFYHGSEIHFYFLPNVSKSKLFRSPDIHIDILGTCVAYSSIFWYFCRRKNEEKMKTNFHCSWNGNKYRNEQGEKITVKRCWNSEIREQKNSFNLQFNFGWIFIFRFR